MIAACGLAARHDANPQAAQRVAMAPLRLLLFGPTGAGKSSLLGALVQAGSSQAAVLKGTLKDDAGKLAALRESTYAGAPAPTPEVTAYPFHFVPQDGEPHPLAGTLIDCDGKLAQDYLSGRRPLEPGDSSAARTMLKADTVVLTLDASAAGSAVEAQLATSGQFLTRLQEARGRHALVADLPVYLVLTKCDQLAKPGDTFSKWLQRIEEAKRILGERFAAFLADDPSAPAFGTIDLNLWATAIRRPPLADRPAPAAEPYGVAELFRQCLAAAQGFDRREDQAGRRLEGAVGGLGFLVILLTLLAALFAAAQPDTERTRLEEQVQAVLPDPNARAERRLSGAVKLRLAQIQQIQGDPAFEKLPRKTREAVQQAADELSRYVQARQEFQTVVKPPYQAKNEEEFDRFERQTRDFALPAEYADAWATTRLAAQASEIRREYTVVRAAIGARVRWIRDRTEEGRKLDDQAYSILPQLRKADKKTKDQLTRPWFAAFADYQRQPHYRHPGDESVPGVTSFVYADLDRFGAVRHARKEWDKVRKDLEKAHDLITERMAE
jgi:hypothetical protein